MPKDAYFIDAVQALFLATAGTCAAGYYQRKLAQQKVALSKDLDAALLSDTPQLTAINTIEEAA